jgi:hypothetical protein
MVVPMASVNVVSVKRMGRANRKEKVLERVMKYWLRSLEID